VKRNNRAIELEFFARQGNTRSRRRNANVAAWQKGGWSAARRENLGWLRMLLQRTTSLEHDTLAIVIEATSDFEKVDRKMRSKWSRVLRFAEKYKSEAEPLITFITHQGGINGCAALYARRLGRSHQT
jgi:hypothetical protein